MLDSCPAPLSAAEPLHELKVACSSCSLRELCLPLGMRSADVERLDTLVANRRRVRRGGALFHVGDPFTALYAVRTGFFKSCVASEDGANQVTGFQMAG